MRKDKLDNRVPKYYHSDGNGIHLEVGKVYKIRNKGEVAKIEVIREYKYFYLVLLDDKYNYTIHKFFDDVEFLVWSYYHEMKY